jgi:hypothetical protein
MRAENVPLGKALTQLLAQARLVYVFRDEVVFVTTKHVGLSRLKTEVYPVADLVLDKEAGKLLYWNETGPEPLIRLLTGGVMPYSWSAAGGDGTIKYYPRKGALVVCQTADAHEQLRSMLASLRRHVKEARAEAKRKEDGASPPSAGEPCEEGKPGAMGCPLKGVGGCCTVSRLVKEVFGAPIEKLPGGHFEIDVGPKGVRVYGKVPVGGFILHVLYEKDACKAWASGAWECADDKGSK